MTEEIKGAIAKAKETRVVAKESVLTGRFISAEEVAGPFGKSYLLKLEVDGNEESVFISDRLFKKNKNGMRQGSTINVTFKHNKFGITSYYEKGEWKVYGEAAVAEGRKTIGEESTKVFDVSIIYSKTYLIKKEEMLAKVDVMTELTEEQADAMNRFSGLNI